jgi:hypothetical protein
MEGEPIPHRDHVARYVSPSKYVNKVLDWSALLPRPQDNGEGSYNWLENLGNGTLQELIEHLRSALTTLRISKNGTFAVLNVGRAISGMRDSVDPSIELRFVHTPKPGNESHASMFGLDHTMESAGVLLNGLCDIFPTSL